MTHEIEFKRLFADAVQYVQSTYYVEDGARRSSGNAFLRLKLGRELDKRNVEGTLEPD